MVGAMSHMISLNEAETRLSSLVNRAAAVEEVVVTKNGVPQANSIALISQGGVRTPVNALDLTYISDDFDAPDPEIEAMFAGA